MQPSDLHQLKRRTPVLRILRQAGAQFTMINQAAAANHYGNADAESVLARRMGLADLSSLPRGGFKGAGAPEWLREHGVVLPAEPNRTAVQEGGELVAALSWEEHLVLNSLPTAQERDLCAVLNDAWSLQDAPRCYQLPRQDSHCWFAISGEHCSAMLAKLCAVDMRFHKFANGSVAQTSLARINAIIIRHDLNTVPLFYILADSASADYLWPCLIDAMAEFDGGPIGLGALRSIASSD